MNTKSKLLIAGGLLAAYLFYRSGSSATATLTVRAYGNGTLFVNGQKAVDLADGATVNVPVAADTPLVLRVDFADGTSSGERTLTIKAGGVSLVQVFTPKGVNIGQVSYTNLSEQLAKQGKTERANAVSMLADAHNLILTRQYEAASGKYGEIIATFPGTPEAKSALGLKAILDFQLRTPAGRAALDRANPIR